MVDILRPHFENFSRRLVKSPKVSFTDTGPLRRVLGIRNPNDLRNHPLRGPIFEAFDVSEVRKLHLHHGQRSPLSFWRDSNAREVDLVVDAGARRIPIEIKSSETVARDFLKGPDTYLAWSGDSLGALIYGGGESYRRRDHWI